MHNSTGAKTISLVTQVTPSSFPKMNSFALMSVAVVAADRVTKSWVDRELAVGEQRTMFFRDPSGNALEFKAFPRPEALFES